MAGFKKFGCGPIGLIVLFLIVFAVVSNDDDEQALQPQRSAVPSSVEGHPMTGNGIAPSTYFVVADVLNVRTEPASSAQLLLKLPRGQRVTVSRRSGSWYGIQLTDGTIGWLHGDYLADQPPAQPSKLVRSEPTEAVAQNSKCHPSYAGRCLPVVGDLDCGDIAGSVRVVGPDVYRLDRDRDGVGCE